MNIQQRLHSAQFTVSANQLSQLPNDVISEVAMAGRSNSGKSSAINTMTQQKSLARISKTPGRTQLINYFSLGEHEYLVDLPGYGYAKVPEAMRLHWQKVLQGYFETRQSLCGLLVTMDIRHPLSRHDEQMLLWCTARNLPVHILLTKADKLNRGPAMNTCQKVRDQLKKQHCDATVQIFSSQTRAGVEEVWQKLTEWLALAKSNRAL